MTRNPVRIALLFALLLPISAPVVAIPVVSVQGAGPVVSKCDPPSWWVGHPWAEVQLLVRGKGLQSAALRSSTPGVEILRQSSNAAGTSLIAYARIGADARPGAVSLFVHGQHGRTPVPFTLLSRPDPTGRFAGLTPDDVIYLIMPDRFADGSAANNGAGVDRSHPRAYHGGDIAGIRQRLTYLKDLGVTAIWMTPIYDNDDASQDYHGYHTTDYYDIEERFGTMDEFRAFVDEAHRMGIKVVQDQVANHVGPKHPWVQDSPNPTWFNGTVEKHSVNPFRIDAVANPSLDPKAMRETLDGWFAGVLPDLNQDDPDVAFYLIQNSLWWVEATGIDAIRQDTMPYAPRSFWAKWVPALKAAHPKFTVLGEVFEREPKVNAFFQGGAVRDGIDSKVDSLFDFPLAFAMFGFLSRRQEASAIAKILEADGEYPDPMMLVTHAGNHDTDRLLTLVHGDPDALRLAHVMLLSMRGAPQLYYGDEIALPGGEDPDNRRDFPGGFPGDARSAFESIGRTVEQQQTFANLKRMLALRRESAALRGPLTTPIVATRNVWVALREGGGERALVAINNGDVPASVDVAADGLGKRPVDGLMPTRAIRMQNGRIAFTLEPRSAAVVLPARVRTRAGR
ncbi:MAG: cyclomaltodextrinase N-terminal domain-containing protein [Blastocatellia bacterium]|nr:cyclomaltodextrinase N-terminal domain-containing protein [Blastocatellia bacterium]